MVILARILLFFAALSLWVASLIFVLHQEAPLPTKLERQWVEDVKLLEASKVLHKGWGQLKDIELHGGTDVSKLWLAEIQVPIEVKPDGQYTLEVLLVDWTENQKIGAMIQYNLVDHKSGNMVWELGRTLILRDGTSPYQKMRKMIMNWLRH